MSKVARIRTSDRIQFKRCRRAWAWKSHLKRNLEPAVRPEPLWTGTGVHFALEDFHGRKIYKTASNAFRAYVMACRRSSGFNLPDMWLSETEMATGMLDYYEEWLVTRDPLQTYILNDIPQLEVNFEIDLTEYIMEEAERNPAISYVKEYDKIVYAGTIDRMSIDEHGRLWIVEYKTARQFGIFHFATDPQVTTYCWAAQAIYGQPVEGVIYQQHKKTIPNPPRLLSTGKYSTAKQQGTTHCAYRNALINLYGSVARAPDENIGFLNWLAEQETQDADAFIRRDYVRRNQSQIAAEGQKILMEIEDMLNPDLPLYPNPSRECSYCDMQSACVTLDDGGDWEQDLLETTRSREEESTKWHLHLPTLQEVLALASPQ